MRYLLSGILAILFSAQISHAKPQPPVGWAAKITPCAKAVNKWIDSQSPADQKIFRKDLYLTKAEGGSIKFGFEGAEFGADFPGIGLNKTKMPGAGYCCVLDENLNIVSAQMVLHGNNECWDIMRATKNDANKKKPALKKKKWHGMLRWCKGPEANCFMDVWYEYHVE